jgi:hypothetical protein
VSGPSPYFTWQSAESLLARTESDSDRLGENWKRRRGRDFREAFIAARFAKWVGAEAVRLLPPNGNRPTPDFAIKLQSNEFWYETTEIDRRDRRRGSEPPLESPLQVPPNEWVTTADYLEVLRERSAAKAAKDYVKCHGLVIYDNAWPLSDPENQTLDWWRSGTTDARARFSEVWSFDGTTFALIN